jgi:hypothetical protein
MPEGENPLEAKKVHLYYDEAGNLDFTENGSKYFIMNCIAVRRPFSYLKNLFELKYDCNESGYSQRLSGNYQRFHATEDMQHIRDRFFHILQQSLTSFSIYSVIMEKKDFAAEDNPDTYVYAKGFIYLFDRVLDDIGQSELSEIVIVTDTIPTKKKQGIVQRALKEHLKEWQAASGIPYQLYHHLSASDMNLQVVDYISWAIQRKWERDDERSYVLIEDAIISENLYISR